MQALEPPMDIGRGQDLSGKKFGLLTAVYCVGRIDSGNRWLCQCECGRWAVRTASRLSQAIRNGQQSMCAECLRELCSGIRLDRREKNKSGLARYFSKTGLLYSEASDRRHAQEIAAECEQLLGVKPECRESLTQVIHGDDPCPVPPSPLPPSPLFRMLAPACKFYECSTCGRPFRVGFGCIKCVDAVCGVCVKEGEHGCWPEPKTLEQSGDVLGVSRERVRSIEGAALRKMRERLTQIFRDSRQSREVKSMVMHCGKALSVTDSGCIYCAVCGNTWGRDRERRAAWIAEKG